MTDDTTTQGMEEMSCRQVDADAIAERYLLSQLDDSLRDAYERHYFDCERCFHELTTVGALRTELNAAGTPAIGSPPASARRWVPVGVAAAAVIAVGVGVWTMRSAREAGPVTLPGAGGPAVTPQAPVAVAPTSTPPAEPLAISLTALARFEPPPYLPPVLRGSEDEARTRFQAAMAHYARRDYVQAIDGLRLATGRNPDAPDASFFLGVCLLLTRQPQMGITELKRTIALGDSPYREEAHLYLAKGLLQVGDVGAARRELRTMIALDGDHQREAKQLLNQVERTRPGR